MRNEMFSIMKFTEETLLAAPYGFTGSVKIDHANAIDINEELPIILVNDIAWSWKGVQFGQFEAHKLQPLHVEVLAGSKLESLKIADWISGNELGSPNLGDSGLTGILLDTKIPLWRFDADESIIGEPDPTHPGDVLPIGEIIFGKEPLPNTRFVQSVGVADLAYHYIIEFFDVYSILF